MAKISLNPPQNEKIVKIFFSILNHKDQYQIDLLEVKKKRDSDKKLFSKG